LRPINKRVVAWAYRYLNAGLRGASATEACMAPIPRLRSYEGPAILSYGFRPFFLLGSIYAGLAILVFGCRF
jgi:hypothetical protein